MITDCFDGQRLSLHDYIYKMIDNIYPSLKSLGNENVIETLDDIMNNGTESDQQLAFENDHGVNELLHFLMDGVEYNY